MTLGSDETLVARDGDADDVRWALHTAHAQVKQGRPAEAIVWIKRAAEAAEAAGQDRRGVELRAEARRMAEAMWNLGPSAPQPASASWPPPAQSSVPPSQLSPSQAVSGSWPPRAVSQPPPFQASPSQPPPPQFASQSQVPSQSQRTLLQYPQSQPPPSSRRSIEIEVDVEPVGGASRPPGAGPPPLPNRARLRPPPGARPPGAPSLHPQVPQSGPPGFAAPQPARQSLSDTVPGRAPMASAPEIEVEELDPNSLLAISLREVAVQGDSVPPRAATSSPPFNDRLSSVDIEPLRVDAVLPSLGSNPPGGAQASVPPGAAPNSVPPAPESVRRALALIDDEEILQEEEDQRVTQDLGFVAGFSNPPPGSVPPLSSVPPSAPPSESVRQSAAQTLPPPAAPASTRAVSIAPQSQLPNSADLRSGPPTSRRAQRPATVDLGELTLEVSDLGPPSRALELVDSIPPSAPAPVEAESNEVDGIQLDVVRGFEDLPEEIQRRLAARARVEHLDQGEEVAFFGAAVVTQGSVDILPAISDEAGAVAHQADVVFTKGTLDDSIALRVVAKIEGTRVAVWEPEVLEEILAECPWVHDELRFIADYFLAVCGATLGPLGERLDDSLRSTVFRRLEVRALQPHEVLLGAGETIPSLFVVGGGRLELLDAGGAVVSELAPGGFVFPDRMMTAQAASHGVRAGAHGALVLFAPRAVAHELMMSVPPLLEVLAG